ncbi:MAG: alpha/beta fold hydrolase [Caldilinea sp.]|uniref:alpha/beta fold hydrolase n=1 Tax=Caldilinea sp. TaxID=2293560 RepID=UPI002CDE6969|nr:alpha/beta fold hydrolase [Anaerolineales bacterium]HQY91779.1 alpha/beta fold hydrolase [Caldilinea sp.]HRA64427.1 alpha/beta fold hydrolase [Caldilinea sp.]
MTSVTHRIPGLVLTDHTFRVPLDHARPHAATIEVFARAVSAAGKATDDLPWLLFLQGGPGFAAPRPLTNSGWIKRAVSDYHVLLLDQRGTGRSTPLTFQTLAHMSTPQAQAEHLKHFRADAIVQDAEWIRRALLGESARWSVLGQSYGGFCATHYLSVAPHTLSEVFITGGLPPLTAHPDDIYRTTYRHVIEKNQRYYARYPDDVAHVQAIAAHLAAHEVLLPTGDRLTPRRFQQLGLDFGASDGFERIHYLLEEAFVQGAQGVELSHTFLRGVETLQAYDANPLFAILHEAIYCQGFASRWSAARVRQEFPEFELRADAPLFFTGEMIYPWMFEEYRHLRPLQAAAELLAADDAWPALYDPAILRANTVPVAATIYYDDMYVAREFAVQTAATIRDSKVWITNEYEHNALRADGEVIFGRLLEMARGQR